MDSMIQLDRAEFITRMKALTDEQKRLALKEMPDRMLWDELEARFVRNKRKIQSTEKAMRLH